MLLTHDPQCLELPDAAHDTPLICAVMTGNIEIIAYLLSLKPNLNCQNINQRCGVVEGYLGGYK